MFMHGHWIECHAGPFWEEQWLIVIVVVNEKLSPFVLLDESQLITAVYQAIAIVIISVINFAAAAIGSWGRVPVRFEFVFFAAHSNARGELPMQEAGV